MKRFVSLFFLVLVFLNAIGYYGLLLLVQEQITAHSLQRIEMESTDLGGNLVLVIPLEIPYGTGTDEYVPAEGEFIYQGSMYSLVKQKFYRDMLYMVCVRNEQSNLTQAAMADYSKLFSGQEAGKADLSIKLINSLSKDYLSKVLLPKGLSSGWSRVSSPTPFKDLYRFDTPEPTFQPPENS